MLSVFDPEYVIEYETDALLVAVLVSGQEAVLDFVLLSVVEAVSVFDKEGE